MKKESSKKWGKMRGWRWRNKNHFSLKLDSLKFHSLHTFWPFMVGKKLIYFSENLTIIYLWLVRLTTMIRNRASMSTNNEYCVFSSFRAADLHRHQNKKIQVSVSIQKGHVFWYIHMRSAISVKEVGRFGAHFQPMLGIEILAGNFNLWARSKRARRCPRLAKIFLWESAFC